VNKYRKGKLKRTLERESKDRETAQSTSRWRWKATGGTVALASAGAARNACGRLVGESSAC